MANIAKVISTGTVVKVAINGAFREKSLLGNVVVNFNAAEPQYRKFPESDAVYQLGKAWNAFDGVFSLVAVPVATVDAAPVATSKRSSKCDRNGNPID